MKEVLIKSFEDQIIELGTVECKKGEQVPFEVKLVNLFDDITLSITSVSSSCGCTTPSYTKGMMDPKEDTIVKAVFDSAGRPGSNYKSFTVSMNVRGLDALKLQFKFTVIAK